MREDTRSLLTPEQRERLLRDVWIAHDGRWFLKTVQALGFETANTLNHAVIRSLGKTELKRLMAETNVAAITGVEELRALLEVACDLYMPREHRYEIAVVDDTTVAGRVLDCYVFRNVSAAGGTEYFRCAAKARFTGWLEASGLSGEVIAEQDVQNCGGACQILLKLASQPSPAP